MFPKALYEARKDDIKAPLRAHGLKWVYLGPDKGRYHKDGVNVFVQFKDDTVDYSIWGTEQDTVQDVVAAWRKLLGGDVVAEATAAAAEANAVEERAAESGAVRRWELEKPVQRPGEPAGFFHRRVAEWEARRPPG